MSWWSFCCGDERSVQPSSSNSPEATSLAGAVPAGGANTTESSPLHVQSVPTSAAVAKEEIKDESESPPLSEPDGDGAKVAQPPCGDSKSTGGGASTEEVPHTDLAAWKEARAKLLQSRPSGPILYFPSQVNERTSVLQSGDLMRSELLEYLPKPTAVKHVAQLSTWDCGIACLEMVLDWLGIAAGIDRQAILERIPTRSVWSADLVQLLDQQLFPSAMAPIVEAGSGTDGVTDELPSLPSEGHPSGRYLFCSQALSVNDELNSFAYYQNTFESDRTRVGAVFQWLQERRRESLLQIASLPMSDVVELLLRPDCVAIVLVDNAILTGLRRADAVTYENCGNVSHQEVADGVTVSSGTGPVDDPEQPTIIESTSAVVYMGHYILLTGVVPSPKPVVFDSDSDDSIDDDGSDDEPFQFQAYNPSLDFGPVLLSPRLLDDARRAPGTDHDILFLVKLT